MLKIRNEQIRPFQPKAEDAFISRVMEYLRKNHADTTVRLPISETFVSGLPDKILREMVSGGVEKAGKYGISWASNLISFVVLMFIVAPNFDVAEQVQKVLRDEEIPNEKRIDKLLKKMTDDDWEEIAKKYDASAWRLSPVEAQLKEKIYERAV